MAITVGLTERKWYRKIWWLIMFPFNVAIAGGEFFANFLKPKMSSAATIFFYPAND
jgi:hypothetical protein